MTYIPFHQDSHFFDGRLTPSTVHPCDCAAGEDEFSPVASSIGLLRDAKVSGLPDFPDIDDPANLNLVPWMYLPRRARHRNEQPRLFRQ